MALLVAVVVLFGDSMEAGAEAEEAVPKRWACRRGCLAASSVKVRS